jgi:hypothetical protein
VEVLNWLSVRRRSKGLLGEHKPVECVEAGIQKTIWSSTSKNELCSEETETLPKVLALKLPLAGLDSTTDAKFSTHTPTSSESTNEMKDISNLGSERVGGLSLDINTLLFIVILCVLLAVTTFITLVAVHYFTNFIKCKRGTKVSPCFEKIVGKYKVMSSGKPSNSSSCSSGLIENHSSALSSNSDSVSYTDNCDHFYETVD